MNGTLLLPSSAPDSFCSPHQRWFVLNTDYGTLDYYINQDDERPKGSIELLTSRVSVVPNRKNCFSIVTTNRSYCVTAESEMEMKEWMNTIQAAQNALLELYEKEINSKVKKEVLIAGHLIKQGKNVLGDWRRRWCILRTDALYYYKSESNTTDSKEMGKINMLLASAKPGNPRRHSFDVSTSHRIYHFQASSSEEMLEWINKIRQASESLFRALPSDVRDRSSSQALKELLLEKANQFCADCGMPEPRWASVNLGVFVCIECSGIHRHLGVEHSRVRSLELDSWDQHSIQKMASMGNRRADEIWEHLVPAEWTALKPTPADDRTKKEEWIKAKYIEQLFVRPDAAKNTALQCEPDKEGWLLKWSTKSGSWKKRWFALNNGDLCYFKLNFLPNYFCCS